MARNTIIVGREWVLATPTPSTNRITVQMRPRRDRPPGRIFMARGTDTVPPGDGEGYFLDPWEGMGKDGFFLESIDPGGTGHHLWVRHVGPDPVAFWASWN